MAKWKKLKSLAFINTLALGTMYALNQIISSSAILKNILKPQTGSYYQWKLGDIFYRKSGNGSPLLLIHDLNSFSSGFEWNLIEKKLQKNHTVYTIDLLGCGRSDKPAITYTNYLYVQLITAFIKDIIGEKTDVIATGLSSSFTIMAAYGDPSLINHIIMMNPCSFTRLEQIPDKKSKIIRTIMNIPIIGTTIYSIKSSRQNVEYALTEKYMYNPFRIQQKYVDAYYEAAHYGYGTGKYLMASLDGFYLNVNIRKALASIENEIYIIYGENMEKGKEISESYQQINKKAKLFSIHGTKLLPQLETPEEFLTRIRNIL